MLVTGIALALVGPALVSEGMFVDGVTYASIARNMAEGQGSFWDPFYTQTLYPHFRQHPPLALGMEALLFKVLGDHLYVEKLYSLLVSLLSGLMTVLIWKRTTNNVRMAWLPMLFLVTIPLVTWAVPNNMLENTMTVFVLLSVYLMLLSYQRNNKTWLFLSALPLFLAFLTKGFTGLFPLVFPIIYCLFDKKRRGIQGPVDSLLVLLTMALLAGITIFVFPESLPYMKDYVRLQVLGGGMHEATSSTRFFIVWRLLQELAIPMVLVALLLVLRHVRKISVKVFEFPGDKTMFWVFLLLGLSGVLPIMVSVKQRGFYMLAAFPFFALSLGHLSLGTVRTLFSSFRPSVGKWLCLVSCVVLFGAAVWTATCIGKYGRDSELIETVKQTIAEEPENHVLHIAPEEYTNWGWHAYYMRYGKISLDPSNK